MHAPSGKKSNAPASAEFAIISLVAELRCTFSPQLHREGKARAIGVCNFCIPHLEDLLENCAVRPCVNQVEFHPYLYQSGLLEFCRSKGIVVEAYSSLGNGNLLGVPEVAAIARELQRSPAQVLLRWGLQKGCVVLPKSTSQGRIEENGRLFDFSLSEKELGILDGLHRDHHFSWNPYTGETLKYGTGNSHFSLSFIFLAALKFKCPSQILANPVA